MLSLGIPIDFDDSGNTIVDLNMGGELKVRDFPQDSEFQLRAFNPSAKTGTVIWIKQLAEDVGKAMAILDELGLPKGRKPEWYRRLTLCATGAATGAGL